MLPRYRTISIMSFSPIKGVRRTVSTTQALLDLIDRKGHEYRDQVEQLTKVTRQPDTQLRLVFGLWAIDQAPSKDLAERVPLELMILHRARELSAWEQIKQAPALNIVLLDWPVPDSYETRIFLVGADDSMPVESLPYFYEARRDEAAKAGRISMPAISTPAWEAKGTSAQ